MRKIFLKYHEGIGYWIVKNSQTINYDLQNLWSSFYLQNDWIVIEILDGQVTIWNSFDVKRKKEKDFISYKEKKKYDDDYSKYLKKKGKEIPMLEITENNYQKILKDWEQIRKNKKNYLIISIDDFGVVSLEGKDKLSEKDKIDLKKEHEKNLEFNKKYEALEPFRKKTNYEWQSPDDEDYDSDYFTDKEMVWKSKKF